MSMWDDYHMRIQLRRKPLIVFKPVVFCQHGRRWQLFVLWWRWNMWEKCQWIWRWLRNLCFSTNRLDHPTFSLSFLCSMGCFSVISIAVGPLAFAMCCCAFVWAHRQFFPVEKVVFWFMVLLLFNSRIDKLGPVGRWLRHRLLSSILIGTPPLVALQVNFCLFAARRYRIKPSGFLLSWLRQMFYEHFFPLFKFTQLSFTVFRGYGFDTIYFVLSWFLMVISISQSMKQI